VTAADLEREAAVEEVEVGVAGVALHENVTVAGEHEVVEAMTTVEVVVMQQ
jgi:hypothetical protein